MSTNIYKKFLGLLPNPSLQVGEVTAIAGGVATVELPGGGVVRARGSASVSDFVFVRNGAIEAVTDALSVEVIDI